MSYDLQIRSDDEYSRYAAVKPLAKFIASLPGVRPNGQSFMVNQGPHYMEIEFEVVDADGEDIEEYGKEYPEINAVRFHIPYPHLGEAPERDYFPTVYAIAKFLGWRVFDDQRGEYLDPEADNRAVRVWSKNPAEG
jgi:hypothetical protein